MIQAKSNQALEIFIQCGLWLSKVSILMSSDGILGLTATLGTLEITHPTIVLFNWIRLPSQDDRLSQLIV